MKNHGIIEAYNSSKWHFYRLNPEFENIHKIVVQMKNKESE